MIKYFEILEKIIGDIAWPLIVLIIFYYFRKEVKTLFRRIKSAEIKNVKFELEDKIDNIRETAIDNNVTMYYPLETLQMEFNKTKDKSIELQIIDSWKRIEAIISALDDRGTHKKNISDSINYLSKTNKIEKYLAKMIINLKELRNITVHNENVQVNDDEYQYWISISKSVIDRLNNKL